MEPTAYITQPWNSESDIGQGSMSKALKFTAFNNLCAEIEQSVREEVQAEFQASLTAKEKEIELLKLQIAQLRANPQHATHIKVLKTPRIYNYNSSCFSKPNGEIVIEVLIELTNCKREGGKYIINSKTDWYLVWKVLHYFKIYKGSAYDFIYLVNECVLPYIDDEERRKALELNDSNFKSIKQDNPMKKHAVMNWRRELENEREACSASQHGTLVLDRGVNIMVKLQQLLKARGIESYNYET